MTRDDDRKPTLAGELDRTRWDYSPSNDRRFLLAPLSRIFESIVWGSKPHQGKTAVVQEDSEPTGETDEK